MDYIAGLLELLGSYLIGNKNKIGFLLNILGCILWIYVAIQTQIYGLLLVVIPAIVINSRNFIKWTRGGDED